MADGWDATEVCSLWEDRGLSAWVKVEGGRALFRNLSKEGFKEHNFTMMLSILYQQILKLLCTYLIYILILFYFNLINCCQAPVQAWSRSGPVTVTVTVNRQV